MPLDKTQLDQLDAIKAAAETDPERERALVDFVTNRSAGMYLTGSNQASPLRSLPHSAFQRYFDEIYANIGIPSAKDPIHKMMAEQLVVAHHAIGRLMMEASQCNDAEMLRSKYSVAIQLMGEFRRMSLALNSYGSESEKPVEEPTVRANKNRRKVA